MTIGNYPYEKLSDPLNLWKAWKQFRCRIRTVDGGLTDLDRTIQNLIFDAAAELNEGSYFAMQSEPGDLGRNAYAPRGLDQRQIKDAIIQQAVFNVVEPIYAQVFLDCSVLEPRAAAERLRGYRLSGDRYVLRSEIAEGFDSINHELLIQSIGEQTGDDRLLGLIWMWLKTKGITTQTRSFLIRERPPDFTEPVEEPIQSMIDLLSPGDNNGERGVLPAPILQRVFRSIRHLVPERFGTSVILILFTSVSAWAVSRFIHRPISLNKILLAVTALFGALNYNSLLRALGEGPQTRERARPNYQRSNLALLPQSPLVPLFTDIVLHEFDKVMTEAGFHYVRYQDRFAVSTFDRESANQILDFAAHELKRLKLELNPHQTYVKRLGHF